MNKNEIINKRAIELQNDCHNQVFSAIRKNKKLGYQDTTNVWIFRKLAELEYNIATLNVKKSI